jgi:DNA polymerase
MDLQTVKEAAATCTECELCVGRLNPVFAKGNPLSKIFVCGMVPAHEENKIGLPFVGRAGQCLDILLESVGLSIDDVYVTNIVKCFLAPGVKLKQEWVSNCLPYLIDQINVIKPKVIVTLGADATNGLLGLSIDTKIGETRGRVFRYLDTVKVVPTYHPSYLVRGGCTKSPGFEKARSDFGWALSFLN